MISFHRLQEPLNAKMPSASDSKRRVIRRTKMQIVRDDLEMALKAVLDNNVDLAKEMIMKVVKSSKMQDKKT